MPTDLNTQNDSRNAVATVPDDYADALEAERRRVAEDVLSPRALDQRRVLLIGGGGYIGTVLTGSLLAAGFQVRCIDCFLYRNQSALLPFVGHPEFAFVHGDLTDRALVRSQAMEATDVVILGGLVGDPITKKYPEESTHINLNGVKGVLAALDGCGLNRVIFISTCSNYGKIGDNETADENHTLTPLSLYAEAKVAVEKGILDAPDPPDYQPVVLRFATAFGLSPRMRFDLTVSEFTREMYLGRELLVYDPDTWRPYCHVRDFADVIHRVLVAPPDVVSGQVFNAGGDANNYTKRQLVDELKTFFPDAAVRFQDHGGDPRNYRVDFSKIRKTLHFEPSYLVRDGIAELVGAFKQRLFDNVDDNPDLFGNYTIDYEARA